MSGLSELDRLVGPWREGLRGRGLGGDDLDELTDHLLLAIEERTARGERPAAAFERARERLGDERRLVRALHAETSTMTTTSKLLGGALALAALALAFGGDPFTLVHLPALVLVLGVVAGGLVAGFGPHAVAAALRAGLAAVPEHDEARRRLHLAVCRRGASLAWAAGAVGALLGVIQVLTNISDPSELGPGLAATLLSPLYGALLAELGFRSLAQWLEARPARG